MRATLLIILLGSLLCACGQKGPLFMPNDNSPAANSSANDSANNR